MSDDGNTANGDGCSSVCQVEKHYECFPSMDEEPVSTSTCTWVVGCGNGKVEYGEGCDDGDGKGGGCSSTCTIEKGFECTTTPNGGSACSTICGDNILAGSEACDTNSPGCIQCTVVRGYTCLRGVLPNGYQHCGVLFVEMLYS